MSRRVVCNTGPLIGLALVGRLDILARLFDAVLVPETVYCELIAGGQDDAGLRMCETTPWFLRATLSRPVDA